MRVHTHTHTHTTAVEDEEYDDANYDSLTLDELRRLCSERRVPFDQSCETFNLKEKLHLQHFKMDGANAGSGSDSDDAGGSNEHGEQVESVTKAARPKKVSKVWKPDPGTARSSYTLHGGLEAGTTGTYIAVVRDQEKLAQFDFIPQLFLTQRTINDDDITFVAITSVPYFIARYHWDVPFELLDEAMCGKLRPFKEALSDSDWQKTAKAAGLVPNDHEYEQENEFRDVLVKTGSAFLQETLMWGPDNPRWQHIVCLHPFFKTTNFREWHSKGQHFVQIQTVGSLIREPQLSMSHLNMSQHNMSQHNMPQFNMTQPNMEQLLTWAQVDTDMMSGDAPPYVPGPLERQIVPSQERRTVPSPPGRPVPTLRTDSEVHAYYNAISTRTKGKRHMLEPEVTVKNVWDHVEAGTWQRLPPLKETFHRHPVLFGIGRRAYWQKRQRIANAVKMNIDVGLTLDQACNKVEDTRGNNTLFGDAFLKMLPKVQRQRKKPGSGTTSSIRPLLRYPDGGQDPTPRVVKLMMSNVFLSLT
jgi:hypothetical protein